MTEHLIDTHHAKYFQTYGNVWLNIGLFKYSLTMIRSLVKLEWKVDFEEQVKSIHLVTPKALFMQEMVTDFRKSLDRTISKAKLREIVTLFVRYTLVNKLEINVDLFMLWKNSLFHVKLNSQSSKLKECLEPAFFSFIPQFVQTIWNLLI